jgi:hypothetical protein
MAWPLAAIVQLGLLGFLLLPQAAQGSWLFLIVLTLAGAVLTLTGALAVGGLAFVALGFWLFASHLEQGLAGVPFVILALTPFAPLWLSAFRERQRETARLDALLELPQVRAGIDISDWSLLPVARVIDRRLAQHAAEQGAGTFAPAWLWRFRLPRFDETLALLGQREVQSGVMRLADDLRRHVRTGDYIAEDVRTTNALYLLAFPNPDNLDRAGLSARLRRAVERTGLPHVEIATAVIPNDGDRLGNVVWHVEEGRA